MDTRLPLSMAKMAWLVAFAVLTGVFPVAALADGCTSSPCNSSFCGPICPNKTVCVPETCWEKQIRKVTKYREETQCRTVTKHYLTPESKEVPYTYSVCVPKMEMRTESYQETVPYVQAVEQAYTVMVPELHERTVTKYLAVPVVRPVKQPYTVMVPEYKTRTENFAVAIPVVRQVPQQYTVMIPEHHTRNENYTVYIPVPRQVPQQYSVMIPEHHTRTVNYTVNQPVMRSVTQNYVVQIPETRNRVEHYTVNVPDYKSHPVNYTVMVPYTKTKQAKRPVYKMIPCKVTREICEDQGCWQNVPCEQPKCNTCDETQGECTCQKEKTGIQRTSHQWSAEENGYAYGSCYGNCDGGLSGYPANPIYSGAGYGMANANDGYEFGAPLPPGFEYPPSALRMHLRRTRDCVREHLPVVGIVKSAIGEGGLFAVDCVRAIKGSVFGPGGTLGDLHGLCCHRGSNDCGPCECDGCPSASTCDTGCESECQPKCKRVWVSKIVKREVCETYWKTVQSEEEYSYNVTCYRPETRTRTVYTTHYRPEIRSRNVAYTVMRPEVRTCERLVTNWVPRTFTQEIPYTTFRPEVRTRMVTMVNMVAQVRTRVVPYTTLRAEVRTHMVNVPSCKYETRSRIIPYCVMRPEARERTVFVTNFINKPYTVNVPYVTQKPEQRTHTVYQTLYRHVTRTREIPYTSYQTVTKHGTRCEVVYKKVPYQSKETFTCEVPYEVEEEVCVPVVKMKSVTVEVPEVCPCDTCNMGPCEPCCEDRCFLKRLFD